jgi:hypothetical protein
MVCLRAKMSLSNIYAFYSYILFSLSIYHIFSYFLELFLTFCWGMEIIGCSLPLFSSSTTIFSNFYKYVNFFHTFLSSSSFFFFLCCRAKIPYLELEPSPARLDSKVCSELPYVPNELSSNMGFSAHLVYMSFKTSRSKFVKTRLGSDRL